MKRKRILIILLVLLVVVVLFIAAIVLWKCSAGKVEKTMTLCSAEGEKIEVVFDVSRHYYLLGPTELRGSIVVDGVEYVSLQDTNFRIQSDSIIEGIERKWNGSEMTWFKLPATDVLDAHQNNVFVIYADKDFDEVVLLVTRDGEATEYCGPAATAEEADGIYKQIYGAAP